MREPLRDPTPLTWEIPVAALSATVVLLALGLPAGQALAHLVAHGALAWPRHRVLDSVVGLARGHPGLGLTAGTGHASTWLVYSGIALVEVALLLALSSFASTWRRILGIASESGLASRSEIEAVLGRRALLRRAAVIRPDLARSPLRFLRRR